jgi:hypothetical protein
MRFMMMVKGNDKYEAGKLPSYSDTLGPKYEGELEIRQATRHSARVAYVSPRP